MGYKQDMPPPGGYKDIYWRRTQPKTGFTAAKGFGGAATCFILGYWTIRSMRKRSRRLGLEENDIRLASECFIAAERDRRHLRMLRELRANEEELMKDHPGWKTGTFYGEPVYYTMPDRKKDWWFPGNIETWAQSPWWKIYLTGGLWNRDELCAEKSYGKFMPDWYHDWGVGTERPYKGAKFGAEHL